MMASLIRIGLTRCVNSSIGTNHLFWKTEINLVRNIRSKAVRDRDLDRLPRPKPFDYHGKRYRSAEDLHRLPFYWLDRTTSRFDENSKLIVVEGPVAAGKTEFAKALAQELDMVYFPEANLDMIYINDYGYDLRQLDDQLPESCKSFDIKDFLLTPKHFNCFPFQYAQYRTKFSQYVDALAHILSTGEGVVLDRCVYSDFVFAEAMYSQRYISKAAFKYYYEVRQNTLFQLLRPHLIVYLDVPVPGVLENIKKRSLSCEKNSQVLTPEYLATMDKFYKQVYLNEMKKSTEILIYDWSEKGEVDIVVEDIQRIEFDNYDRQEIKSADWREHTELEWGELRNLYADRKDEFMACFNIPAHRIPEMMIGALDTKLYNEIKRTAPGERYAVGYNAEMGDTGLWLKNTKIERDTLPRRERILT